MNYEQIVEELELDQYRSSGPGWAVARCPLHDDSSPSLSLNLERGTWKCWSGCGQGKLMDLAVLMKQKGYSFNLSFILSLIDDVGDPLIFEHRDSELRKALKSLRGNNQQQEILPEELLDQYDFYSRAIEARGISQAVADFYGIGFNPHGKQITIPIRDHRGRLRGIEARNLEGNPKYSPIRRCEKSSWLWGGYKYGMGSPLTVFEGALGAARAATLGARGAVATLGASASPNQIDRLRQSSVVKIAFDPDQAGRRGGLKLFDALYKDTLVYIVALPVDIDDITAEELLGALREERIEIH